MGGLMPHSLPAHILLHKIYRENALGNALHVMLFLENPIRTLFVFNKLRSRYCQRALHGVHYQFGDSVFGAESGEHANLAEAGHPLGVAVERGKLVDIAFKAHISITGERLFTCQAKYSCASVEP
jgi:hypothetical protein